MKRVFATLVRTGTFAPFALAYALAASAAPPESADAADPAASVPSPDVPPALDRYRPYQDGEMPSWQQLNADVAREGGMGGMVMNNTSTSTTSAGQHVAPAPASSSPASSAPPAGGHRRHRSGGQP